MNIAVSSRRDVILDGALRVFGRFGYRKTSVQDVADASDISKQGIYLHFSGKDEIFRAAMEKYLSDALSRVNLFLNDPDIPLPARITDAMVAWFGRHLTTFTPDAFDVIEAGDKISADKVESTKTSFKDALAKALIQHDFTAAAAGDIAQVLFLCGLSWKQPGMTPEAFRANIETCVRVCCDGR